MKTKTRKIIVELKVKAVVDVPASLSDAEAFDLAATLARSSAAYEQEWEVVQVYPGSRSGIP